MIDGLLARERINEARREAEIARLINMIKPSTEDQTRRYLTVILCRVGLISAC